MRKTQFLISTRQPTASNEGEYEYSIVKLFENVDVSLDSLFNQIETFPSELAER